MNRMKTFPKNLSRRDFLKMLALAAAGFVSHSLWPRIKTAESVEGRPTHPTHWIRKPIPATGELIPVIGMGTWITFSVEKDIALRDARAEVLREFFAQGGGMIDSSPMYGSAEEVLGYGFQKLGSTEGLFSASKIWHLDKEEGSQQFQNSQTLWGLNSFDLFQIHNLMNWPDHLETLQQLKQKGIIRYIGMTTSHGRRHAELEKILLTQDIDFVQLTYNIVDRQVEDRLLPLAQDQGIAVIANRPFQRGRLIDRLEHKPLPAWAQEFDADNWPQFLLKFIVSHPAVTCTIPATSQVPHMKENMGAAYGPLPDMARRRQMINYVSGLI